MPTHCIGFPPVKIMTHWIVVFFSHLPPSWRLDESWITNLPKVEGRRERERYQSSIGTQCMMPYQCLFFSDFFLDFNKEKGVVKGPLLLLLFCSCLKTPLNSSQIFSLARNLMAFNHPIAFNHLTKNTKLSNVVSLWIEKWKFVFANDMLWRSPWLWSCGSLNLSHTSVMQWARSLEKLVFLFHFCLHNVFLLHKYVSCIQVFKVFYNMHSLTARFNGNLR